MTIVRFVLGLGYVTCVLLTVSAQDRYEAPSPPSEPNTDPEASPAQATDRVRRDQAKDQQIDAIFGSYDQKRENIRKERSYYYRVETPASIISVWRPPLYRLHRPYFIPVFGAEGAIPIYFPPQPLYINAGYPLDNPPYPPAGKPNQGYLPSQGGDSDDGDIGNRFGVDDDRPVWDRIPSRPAQAQPTRRPSRPRTTPFPPLVHNEPTAEPTEFSNREGEVPVNPSTTPKPSQCVWAIVNCCAAGADSVNSGCFERFGCPGPFWDRSPCDSNFAKVAIQSALNYFGDN